MMIWWLTHWCFLATVAVWIGCIIPSLWANVYERILDLPSSCNATTTADESSPSTVPGLPLSTRVTLSSVGSLVYTILAVLFAPKFLKDAWLWFERWRREVNLAAFTRNGLMTWWCQPFSSTRTRRTRTGLECRWCGDKSIWRSSVTQGTKDHISFDFDLITNVWVHS